MHFAWCCVKSKNDITFQKACHPWYRFFHTVSGQSQKWNVWKRIMVSSFRKKSVHICMSFCGYTSPDLLVHIEVFSFFFCYWFRCEVLILCLHKFLIHLILRQLTRKKQCAQSSFSSKSWEQCLHISLFPVYSNTSFFISPLSQFLWTIWSEGALCRPSTAAEHSVKGASVAWTALHRKPIVGYEVWTREQTGSELCRKPADSTCAQCFHFKRQLHPPMTKVLRKLLSLSEAAQRLQPFSNNHDILCWSLELFELWGYFFLASPLFCCRE